MRKQTKAVAALIAAAVLVTVVAPAAYAKNDKGCLAVVVGSKQQLASGGNANGGNGNGANDDDREFGGNSTTFSATKVMDVEFAIIFSPQVAAQFSRTHVVEFRVFSPQGNLYESISIPITSDPARAGEKHRVPGYPDLIPVQVLKPINHGGGRGMFAKVTLPVAGTPIIANSLYGRWSADALVEDELAPCAQPARFTITQ